MGPQVVRFLSEPDVIEIMLNQDGRLWVERLGQEPKPEGTMASMRAELFLGTVAAILKTTVNWENPLLECELPFDGSRLLGKLPPVARAPTFSIRRHALSVFTLDDYVEKGVMTISQKTAIEDGVRNRANMIVAGGTSSGKTTLVNAVIGEMVRVNPAHRYHILEDTREIQCLAENRVELRTFKSQGIDMGRLLKATLRDRPDRIIVGEVRGGEALDLLKAWNTGHPGGAATIHADSARKALTRLEQMVSEASVNPQPHVIGDAVQMVVVIGKTPDHQRKIREIIAVRGYQDGGYLVDSIA